MTIHPFAQKDLDHGFGLGGLRREGRERLVLMPHGVRRVGSQRGQPRRHLGHDAMDQIGNQFADQLRAAPRLVEARIVAVDLPDHLRQQRHDAKVVDHEQAGAQAIVDVVRVIGDIVSNRCYLRFERRVAPQLQIVIPVEIGDADREPMFAIAPDGLARPVGQRTVMFHHAFERFPGQVEAVEVGVAVFQRGDDAQRLRVVVEAALLFQAVVQRPFARMAEWRVAEIVGQRQGLGQVLVEAGLARQRAGDLGDLERVGQPGPVVVALMEDEDLGLVLQPPETGRMDHPVAIAAERAAVLAGRLVELPPPAARGVAGIGHQGSSHSDRHDNFIFQPFDSTTRRT